MLFRNKRTRKLKGEGKGAEDEESGKVGPWGDGGLRSNLLRVMLYRVI